MKRFGRNVGATFSANKLCMYVLCVFLKSGRLEGVLQLFLYRRSGKGHLSVVFLLSGTVGRCSSCLSGKGSSLCCNPALWHGWAVLQLSLLIELERGHLSVVFLLSGTVGRCSSCLSLRKVERVTSLLYSCSLARSGGAPAVSL